MRQSIQEWTKKSICNGMLNLIGLLSERRWNVNFFL